MKKNKLEYLFNPDSVAVIGASNSLGKWGGILLKNILAGNYQGEVYPVNPHKEEIQGLEAYPSILETPGHVDLAIIATPSSTVPGVVEDCIDKGVETAIIISAGFGETGEKGKKLEKEIVSKAREGGFRFAGPNCMGVFSSKSNLHALGPSIEVQEGGVSFFSQSGNLGVQMLTRGSLAGVGFDAFVSSGNEADLKCEDYIDYFRKRSSTKVILGYVEGIESGKKFQKIARKTTEEKPIIIFKSGETEAGKKAAQSHTGKMSGSKRIYDGVFEQVGVIKASNTDNVLNYALAFEQTPPKNNKVAIVTGGGGWGVVAADTCNRHGIKTPQPPPSLMEELNEVLPHYWSGGNPIDMVAIPDYTARLKVIDSLKKWNIGGILVLGGIGQYVIDQTIAKGSTKEAGEELCEGYVDKIIELSEIKTVFAVSFMPLDNSEPVKKLREHNIPVYYDPQTAVKSYSKLIEYRDFLKSKTQ